jgi:hypothetical protein
MTGEKISSNPNTHSSPWDSLASVAERPLSGPESMARRFAKEVHDIQIDFAVQLKRSAERGEKQLPQREFERWEDDYRDMWRGMEGQVREANRQNTGDTMAKAAELEDPVITYLKDTELYQTVEAQAGHYYDERSDALLKAVRGSANPDKEEDLEYVRGFRRAVMEHLAYKYMEGNGSWQSGDADYYNRSRTRAHNDVIKRLNGLNALSEKYGTRRFTSRDFWTSENQNQTPEMSRRMRYDRDIVEEYYAIAFAYEEAELKKEQERNRRFY